MRRKTKIALTAAAVLLAGLGVYLYFLLYENGPALLAEEARCRLGAYSLDGGELAFVRHRANGTLRISDFAGRTFLLEPGSTSGSYRAAGGAGTALFDCGAGTLSLSVDGWPALGKRLALDETPITFESQGDALRGKIVAPAGSAPSIYVVLVHGSEHDSAVFGNSWQYVLAARGFGVVVYDKRGTGLSDGKYSQDFELLADDAVAAIGELRRLVPGSYQVGILGGSQGGWVAPLAATRTRADFVIALYGLAALTKRLAPVSAGTCGTCVGRHLCRQRRRSGDRKERARRPRSQWGTRDFGAGATWRLIPPASEASPPQRREFRRNRSRGFRRREFGGESEAADFGDGSLAANHGPRISATGD